MTDATQGSGVPARKSIVEVDSRTKKRNAAEKRFQA